MANLTRTSVDIKSLGKTVSAVILTRKCPRIETDTTVIAATIRGIRPRVANGKSESIARSCRFAAAPSLGEMADAGRDQGIGLR